MSSKVRSFRFPYIPVLGKFTVIKQLGKHSSLTVNEVAAGPMVHHFGSVHHLGPEGLLLAGELGLLQLLHLLKTLSNLGDIKMSLKIVKVKTDTV